MIDPFHRTIIAALPAGEDLCFGRAAFIAAFVVLAIFILLMPAKLLGDESALPWWRRSRLWAMLIIAAQISIYWYWG